MTVRARSAGRRMLMVVDPSLSLVQVSSRTSSWRVASRAVTRRAADTSTATCDAVAASASVAHFASSAGTATRVIARTFDHGSRPAASAAPIDGSDGSTRATRNRSDAAVYPRPHFHDSHCWAERHSQLAHTWRRSNSSSTANMRAVPAASHSAWPTNSASRCSDGMVRGSGSAPGDASTGGRGGADPREVDDGDVEGGMRVVDMGSCCQRGVMRFSRGKTDGPCARARPPDGHCSAPSKAVPSRA